MVQLNKFFKNKRILITGHTGFKGSWLTAWLVKMQAKVPKATKTWKELASLPLFVDLSNKNLNFILKKVKKFDKNYNKF